MNYITEETACISSQETARETRKGKVVKQVLAFIKSDIRSAGTEMIKPYGNGKDEL